MLSLIDHPTTQLSVMSASRDAISVEQGSGDGDIHEVPLRADDEHEHPQAEEVQEECPPAETPLPKMQLFILLYIQLAEPITSTVIYPFVNQLVRKTGITGGVEDKTGYFAGFIVSNTHKRLSLVLANSGARNLPSMPRRRSVYSSGAAPRIVLGGSRS